MEDGRSSSSHNFRKFMVFQPHVSKWNLCTLWKVKDVCREMDMRSERVLGSVLQVVRGKLSFHASKTRYWSSFAKAGMSRLLDQVNDPQAEINKCEFPNEVIKGV